MPYTEKLVRWVTKTASAALRPLRLIPTGEATVLAMAHHKKVLWAVIKAVTVDVVDMLMRSQWMTAKLFRKQAMFVHPHVGISDLHLSVALPAGQSVDASCADGSRSPSATPGLAPPFGTLSCHRLTPLLHRFWGALLTLYETGACCVSGHWSSYALQRELYHAIH
jgi:hypothetical protein